ncbi:hypothetical protein EDC94DRAFT_381243 [Helicostylum pulchrum]|nr:hypothetical protein EDC94DRAFT_381243 [Helicostylum pulchrum]
MWLELMVALLMLFYIKKITKDELFFDEDYGFELDDLKGIIGPVNNPFDVFGLDPGRVQVFQATFDDLRRISTKEYYNLTGSVAYSRKELKEREKKNMTEIFLRIPTSKTSRISVYFNYVAYILRNLESILRYNGFNKAKDNLLLYRGKQKAPQKCAIQERKVSNFNANIL